MNRTLQIEFAHLLHQHHFDQVIPFLQTVVKSDIPKDISQVRGKDLETTTLYFEGGLTLRSPSDISEKCQYLSMTGFQQVIASCKR